MSLWFEKCSYTLEITEKTKCDVPNLIPGCDIFIQQKNICQAGNFIVLRDGSITQAKKDRNDIFGIIINVMWDAEKCKFPVIHNGNNWFGRSEEEMKDINENYRFRSKADVEEWEREVEERLEAYRKEGIRNET